MSVYSEVVFSDLFKEPPRNGVYKSKEFQGHGMKYVKMNELFTYPFIESSLMEFDRIELSENQKRSLLLQEGDLLFSRTSVVADGVGKCTYIKSTLDELAYDSNIFRIRLDNSKINSLFYYYYFTSPEGRSKVKSLASGAAVTTISGTKLSGLYVPYPHLPNQCKIAEMLLAYDDLIKVNARRIRILETMAQSVYREWFGKVDAKSLPRGWERKPFGELLRYYINGGWGEDEPSDRSPVPSYVIRGTDIPDGRNGQFDKVPFRFHKQSNFASRQLENGDIVIEIAGGSKGQPVGRALLIGQQILNRFDNQVICASFCKMLRPNQSIVSSEYLYLHLREIYENGQIEKYQTQSTGIINFKSSFFLEDNLVIVPDKETMDNFVEFAHPQFDMIETLGAQNANLRRTRDLLLPRLVSGEIDVSDLEIAGPEPIE